MKKRMAAVLFIFFALVIGVGIWYFFQRDYHPAFQTEESPAAPSEEPAEETEDVASEEAEFAKVDSEKAQPEEICGLPVNNEWGVSLIAEDVTPEGLTLVCTQSGGNPTGELSTGAWYEIERLVSGQWQQAPLMAEVCWEDVAWIIPAGESVQWQVSWAWLYGTLEPGDYRMAKEIMDFRQTGDFDTCTGYAYFTIE